MASADNDVYRERERPSCPICRLPWWRSRVQPTEGSKMHRMAPGPNRANLRSATPMGFARAVFEVNELEPAR